MEYAQTRMQARYGAHPDEVQWRQLSEQRDFAGYVTAVLAMPCGSWVAGIDETAGLHEIERTLRRRWRESVRELARWMPEEWRAAVLWTAPLIDWPALAYLAGGHAPPRWLAEELEAGVVFGQASAAEGLAGWIAEWVRRWPEAPEEETHCLRILLKSVQAHLGQFPEVDPVSTWETRRHFRRQLTFAFRAAAMRPAAAFYFLLLQALDLERLRADLVVRVLRRRRPS